jgi:putative membrane protein
MTDITASQVAWRQANPAYIAIQFFRNIRGLVLPFFIILVSRGMSGALDRSGIYIWIGLLIGTFVAMSSVVSWQFFRFGLSDRQLLVKTGFINKQERAVAFERIQAVNIEEAPLDRIFGVVRMRVETAAGGDSKQSDVRIEALRRDEAEELRAFLVRARQRLRGEEPAPGEAIDQAAGTLATLHEPEGQLVRKLSVADLLIAGATSGRIGPAAAIVGFAAQFADDVVPHSWWNRLPWSDVADVVSSVQALFVVVMVLGAMAWVLSVISTVLSIGGFEIRRQDDQLLVQFGLLDRRRLTIPVRRIQAIRVVEGVLRQPFGLAEVRFESAGYNTESGAAGVLFPIMRRGDIPGFLQEIAPDFAIDPSRADLRRVPSRALPRYLVPGTVTTLVMVVLFVAIVWRIAGEVQGWSLFALLLVPVALVYSVLEYLDAGWQIERDILVTRTRSGARETVITRMQRLQHRRLIANWFQRRAGLVTFRGAGASGGGGGHFEVIHIDREDGEYLLAALAPRKRPVTR